MCSLEWLEPTCALLRFKAARRSSFDLNGRININILLFTIFGNSKLESNYLKGLTTPPFNFLEASVVVTGASSSCFSSAPSSPSASSSTGCSIALAVVDANCKCKKLCFAIYFIRIFLGSKIGKCVFYI